jgi:hypothetical protein
MKPLSCGVVFLAGLAVALPVRAGQQAIRSTVMSDAPRNVARSAAAAGRSLSMIQGTAIYADHAPIPYAALRLRNLVTARIEQVTTANYAGDFSFLADPGTPYVVELVDNTGRLLATGGMVSAQAGQTAGALVMLPGRVTTLAGLFGNAAGAIISAAASTGITAVTSTTPPESPEQ